MLTRRHFHRTLTMCLVAVGCVFLTSCGSSGPSLQPATGKLLYEDKPAEGATVVFQLENGPADAPKPSGVVAADGTFKLHTYPHGEGAPEGNYVVLVTWFEPSKNENAESKQKISGKYSDPKTSGLKATIKAGTNTLEPFRLTKQPR
jgi:hypothetical protein